MSLLVVFVVICDGGYYCIWIGTELITVRLWGYTPAEKTVAGIYAKQDSQRQGTKEQIGLYLSIGFVLCFC